MQLDGILIGSIDSGCDVVVGTEGSFEGNVTAHNVRIDGHVVGHIECENLEIMPRGTLTGEVVCAALVINPGGRFRGKSFERNAVQAMLTDESQKAGQAPPAKAAGS